MFKSEIETEDATSDYGDMLFIDEDGDVFMVMPDENCIVVYTTGTDWMTKVGDVYHPSCLDELRPFRGKIVLSQ